ncbi:MAG: hypothetical protein B5M52_00130 [Helicobacteraceae bacterium 4484_230]|nr:MAG: hypothetical protein B5M52_00130 [Helicobacteraceae bacterium 4484_230]
MSLYDAGEEIAEIHANHKEVASSKEILFIFSVFVFILFILYPKTMLHKQVFEEKSNYELTGVYLENMLRLEPENISLMLATAKVSLENGNYDLTKKLISVLRKSESSQIAEELELLDYRLLKTQAGYSSDPEFIGEIKEEMAVVIDHVLQKQLFSRESALVWYGYAMDLSMEKEALAFLRPLYEAGDLFALEQCVYMATEPQELKTRLWCVEKLNSLFGGESQKWLNVAYTLYIEDKNYEKALQTLAKLAETDPDYNEELAQLHATAGDFVQSSDMFISLYKNCDDYKTKKRYLLKAVEVLVGGGLNDRAIKLAQSYEERYLKDEDMTVKFIKLYLSMDRLEAAKKLSVKLLKEQER